MRTTTTDAPDFAPGELVHLVQPEQRSAAIHQLVARLVPHLEGDIRWIDALDHASPATLANFLHEHRLSSIQVARGFTAYQHHALVSDLPESVGGDDGLIVAPAAARLYDDDDVPDHEATAYFEDAVRTLQGVATKTKTSIIVSTASAAPQELRLPLADVASRIIRCERTSMGYRFEGPEWQTNIYWSDGWWQTTIPYWVDLLGSVDDRRVESLADQGAALPMGV